MFHPDFDGHVKRIGDTKAYGILAEDFLLYIQWLYLDHLRCPDLLREVCELLVKQIVIKDAFELKIREYRSAFGHRHPHEMIELSELRAAQRRSSAHCGKHVILGVVALEPLVVVAMSYKYGVLSLFKQLFYIEPVHRVSFLSPQRLMHKQERPLHIAM